MNFSSTWSTLDCGIALVPGDADADHRPDGKSVEHLTLGVLPAGVGHAARIDALLVDAGRLARAFGIRATTNFN